MSCVEIPDEMAELLRDLYTRRSPDFDVEDCRDTEAWRALRKWGWIMESGELTGTGLAHVHDLPGGILAGDH